MSEQGAGGEGTLLTAQQLSERLGGVSVGSIYKMSARGLIPSQAWGPKKGGRRFIEKDVRAALAALHQPLKEYRAPHETRTASPAA